MIIILFSGFVQGLTGFGMSMAAIPFLIRIMPLREIVPIIVVLALFTNVYFLTRFRKEIRFKNLWLLVLAGVLFLPVGTYSLKYLNPDYLKLCFGILVTGFTLLLILKKTFPIKHEKAGYAVTGSLSGFLNGSLSLSGPPVVLFLSIQGTKKDTFRANTTLYFMILNTIAIVIFLANGLLNEAVFEKILYLVPALFIGVFAGVKAFKKLKEEGFRKIVLIMLVVSGVWTTISTLIDLMQKNV
jgi:hypothetical protein